MTRYTVGWNEDLDLNAGAAAIALMKGQDHLREAVSTDQMKLLYNSHLERIMWIDETAGGTAGYIQIGGESRKFRFGLDEMATDPLIGIIDFPAPGYPMPKGTKLDCVGNASGSGAEQHAVLLQFNTGEIPQPPTGNPGSCKKHYMLGLKTGTLTAATFSGNSNVLGQVNAFEDSEEAFAEDDTQYILYGITPSPGGAGYAVCGFRQKQTDIAFPAIMAAAASVRPFWLPEPYLFKGSEDVPLLKGSGVGTTSTEFVMHIGQL